MKNCIYASILGLMFVLSLSLSGCSWNNKVTGKDDTYKEYSDSRYLESLYEINTYTDIVYGKSKNYKGEEIELMLDIYSPSGNDETAKPAILFIHGGGLASGDKATDTLSKSLATDFAKMGYVCFDVNYRLRDEASYAALTDAMSDIAASLKWIQDNSETYAVDKQRIALCGYSSGADIAINLCYSNTTNLDIDRDSILGTIEIAAQNLSIGSPKSDNPPCLIIHGTKDTTIPYQNGENIYNKLNNAGVPTVLYPVEGATHNLSTRYDDIRNQITSFLYNKLTGKTIEVTTKSEIPPEYLKVQQRQQNRFIYEVRQINAVIDGNFSEWETIPSISLNQLKDAGTSIPDNEDFSGAVKIGWNKTTTGTLYIAATIVDDEIQNINPTDGKWYNDDCLEIVFDLSDNNVAEQLLKWVIGAEGEDFSVLADKSNTTVVITKTGNTRNYEIAIDLNNIDPSIRESKDTLVLEDGKTIGFSIAYNDCENGKREHQIGWTAGKSSDRTTLGNLIFITEQHTP